MIAQPVTLTAYDNRDLEPHDVVFSSFAYLIDAARITSANMDLGHTTRNVTTQTLQSADARIVSWFLHLPESKHGMGGGGDHLSDEHMFLAHLCVNTWVSHDDV